MASTKPASSKPRPRGVGSRTAESASVEPADASAGAPDLATLNLEYKLGEQTQYDAMRESSRSMVSQSGWLPYTL